MGVNHEKAHALAPGVAAGRAPRRHASCRGPIGHAQTGGGYNLTWNTIAGGGSTFSTGGGYALGGTAGQAGAGTLTGGGYTLNGGFWAGIPPYATYLPLVLKL